MHPAAMAFLTDEVAEHRLADAARVLDVGGRDVNGTPRHLFPAADYVVLDAMPGPDVDIVGDAADPRTTAALGLFDVVVCAEVLEHAEQWRRLVAACWDTVVDGGRLLVTCASTGRAPHSAHDGGPLRPGEHYGNVTPPEMRAVLAVLGVDTHTLTHNPADGDLYVGATKPRS